ncbi:hypothetical protein BS329_01820 [Amycolatopsis coloradensis]|uniref:Uncharacterized protein n=1 Tax=Amycolatopsis coloradensis TaxID=76021 RepID=A0A1R0L406_9PSEU|nr:hypothetical protein BS329_01820 [Amycolatopsis coloradensis]
MIFRGSGQCRFLRSARGGKIGILGRWITTPTCRRTAVGVGGDDAQAGDQYGGYGARQRLSYKHLNLQVTLDERVRQVMIYQPRRVVDALDHMFGKPALDGFGDASI